jgi:hypothetical protein
VGTSHSWGELSGKINALARDAGDMPKTQVSEASLVVKKSVQTFMPERLRGVGKKGAKLTVRYNEGSFDDGAKALVYVLGPAQLVERDTKAHRIPRDRGRRGRRRYAVIPGVGVRAYAQHPGTKGKHPWQKGVDAAMPIVRRIFAHSGEVLMRRHF